MKRRGLRHGLTKEGGLPTAADPPYNQFWMAGQDTSLGGRAGGFPSTRWSLIVQARDWGSEDARESLSELCSLYWKPVYSFFRHHTPFGNEEIKDLTQDFFAELVGGTMLLRFSPDLGTFRGYLRGALRHFLSDYLEKKTAQKRGGGKKIVHLDELEIERLEARARGSDRTPEEAFEQEWLRSVLAHGLADLEEDLKRRRKERYFAVFDAYEIDSSSEARPTYGSMAERFGVSEREVETILSYCRRRLRHLILRRVREYAGSESSVGTELAEVLASLAGRV